MHVEKKRLELRLGSFIKCKKYLFREQQNREKIKLDLMDTFSGLMEVLVR